jgi:AraC-like DNA-binding protein
MPVRLSTDDFAPRDRLAALREVVGRVHCRYELEPLEDAPVRITMEQHSWSSSSLVYVDTNALTIARTPELVGDGNGDFRLLRVQGTPYKFVSKGVTEDMNDGDAVLLCGGVAGTSHLLASCSVISVRIPHARLAAAVRGLEDRAIRRTKPGSGPLRLLDGYCDLLRRQTPTSDPAFAHHVGQHLIDLVALALDPTEETQARATTGAVRDARLATIRADILANLGQVRLSAKTVAKRHGITDRYVHLLFEGAGQTFNQFVEEQRLKRAFAMLTDPTQAGMRIGEIAFKTGFGEFSTFNRGFRRRFGDTPRGVRRWRHGDQQI